MLYRDALKKSMHCSCRSSTSTTCSEWHVSWQLVGASGQGPLAIGHGALQLAAGIGPGARATGQGPSGRGNRKGAMGQRQSGRGNRAGATGHVPWGIGLGHQESSTGVCMGHSKTNMGLAHMAIGQGQLGMAHRAGASGTGQWAGASGQAPVGMGHWAIVHDSTLIYRRDIRKNCHDTSML